MEPDQRAEFRASIRKAAYELPSPDPGAVWSEKLGRHHFTDPDVCWQCGTPYDSGEDGCDACDA